MPPDRIAVALRDLATTLPEGARLPSVRELMREHAASPVTVQRAIAALAAEGLVTPRPGRGTFVAAPRGRDAPPDLGWQEVALGGPGPGTGGLMELLALPPEGSLALSSGYLDPALQPTAALATSLARAGRRPGAWERPAIEGVAALRAWFARSAGGRFTAHDVVICPGGQAALVTAVRALASAGGTVLVESPTYRGALAGIRAAGLTPLPVPSDADGIRPELLAEALERTGARVIYLQPLHANPHGADLAPARRARGARGRGGGGRLPDRGRLGPRPHHRRPGAGAAGGRRRRRPRRLRPLAEQVRLARAADRGRGGARAGGRAAARGADRRGPVRQRAAPARRARARVLTGLATAPEGAAAWACASAGTRSSARSSATSAGRRWTACRPAGCTCGCGCPRAPTSRR